MFAIQMLNLKHYSICSTAIMSDFIATGHYAKIYKNDLNYHLVRGEIPKEQSYMLYRLPKNWLTRVIFPLGDLTKAEVKKKAREILGISSMMSKKAQIYVLRRDETLRVLSSGYRC